MSRPPYQSYPHHHPHHGRPYIEVHDHDILCGRGVNIASHPGNERFRALVQTRHDANYCTAYTTSEKRAVAEQILHHIKSLDPPGRFLKRIGRAPTSRGMQGPWEELTDREAVKKTCQALRDCNRQDRSGYAAAVKIPEDVRRHAESRSMSGMSNKEQATAAAAAKVRAEGGPIHPQQATHPGAPSTGIRVAMAPGPQPVPPYQMPVPIPMPPAPMAGAPMPVRPDLSTTSSHVYAAAPMPLPPPPPQPTHPHAHHPHPPQHHRPPPPPHSVPPHPPPPHHHHHHHPVHPMHHHHQHPLPPPHAVHHPYPGHAHPPAPEHQQPKNGHHQPLQQPPPPSMPEKPSPVQRRQSQPTLIVHHPPGPAHIQVPHMPPQRQEHRRHSSHSHSSEASKRSRSTYEDDGSVSPSIQNAAEWQKKQKSVDTRAPLPTVTTTTTVNTITPTDPVGPGFLSDGLLSGYDMGHAHAPPARTPSQETSTTTVTTPTSEGTNSLSRAHRPSLSPASAMPPSPTLAYNPIHAGPSNPTLHSHHHDYHPPPAAAAAEHPYAFSHSYYDQAGAAAAAAAAAAPAPDPTKHPYVGTSAHHHIDQQLQLQAAAAAAASAFAEADNQNSGELATSSPGSYHQDDYF